MEWNEYLKQYRRKKKEQGYKCFTAVVPEPLYLALKQFVYEWRKKATLEKRGE